MVKTDTRVIIVEMIDNLKHQINQLDEKVSEQKEIIKALTEEPNGVIWIKEQQSLFDEKYVIPRIIPR